MDIALGNKIKALYRKGMSFRAIGKKLEMSHETVRKFIPAEERRWKRLDSETIKAIIKVFKETNSYQETAEILSLPNRQMVYRIVSQAGLLK